MTTQNAEPVPGVRFLQHILRMSYLSLETTEQVQHIAEFYFNVEIHMRNMLVPGVRLHHILRISTSAF